MKYLSENIITNKKVIVRCDFNVPVKDNKIMDDRRIEKILPTINYLLENNNIVILLSHFGRVKSEEDKSRNSLKIVYQYLQKYFDLEFINDPLNLNKIKESDKKVFLVENTRYTDIPVKRESANDLELSKYWSSFADAFVLDAFGSMHRVHSSTAGLANYLPTYMGFLVQAELENLKCLTNHIDVVIMGGAKVDDKIKVIESLIKKCDYLFLTGGILNTFLKERGYNVGNSLVASDEEVLKSVRKILKDYQDKIKYTDSFVVLRGREVRKVTLKEIQDNDIIYDNIVDLKGILNKDKVVFLNGTSGLCEDSNYQKGTLKLLNDLASSESLVYVGGGDTASFVKIFNLEDKFKYISSGGGATLLYIANNTLPVIDYIEANNVIK